MASTFLFRNKNILLYEKNIRKEIVNMNDGLNHLRTIIRRTEDSLLMSKDPFEIEKIQTALRKLRVELQQKEWKSQRESLVNA